MTEVQHALTRQPEFRVAALLVTGNLAALVFVLVRLRDVESQLTRCQASSSERIMSNEMKSPAQCQDSSRRSYEWHGNRLTVPMQVASSMAGISHHNIIPAQHAHAKIIFELGVNTFGTVRDGLLGLPFFSDHYVVSFEPLLDKWAGNLATHPDAKPIHRQPVGQHHTPVAPSCHLPSAQRRGRPRASGGLHRWLQFAAPYRTCGASNRLCSTVVETRRVPVISLRTALGWLPPHGEVDFLKCDIQGLDAMAILSAGNRIRMIRKMLFEVPIAKVANIGAMNCSVSLNTISSHGFRLANASEIPPYSSLKTKGPLIYKGGPWTCDSAARAGKASGDIFLIRDGPPGRT